MLKLITGPAGAGKTNRIYDEIKAAVRREEGGRFLVVPEQYSHEAERELCSRCGDSLSLYAEVLSFTGLARKVAARFGGINAEYLDNGGRLLCMALSVKELERDKLLRAFSKAASSPDMQNSLLETMDLFRSAGVSPEMILSASESCEGGLSAKLQDLAHVTELYDANVASGCTDPGDRLALLARQIREHGFGSGLHVYFDGFTDFTAVEADVIKALLKTGAEVTVALTLDGVESGDSIYSVPRTAAAELMEVSPECTVEKLPAIEHEIKKEFFSCESAAAECEAAAVRCLELVRTTGCRFRDIAVAVRGFDDYRPLIESAFSKYGVPLFVSKRRALSSRALPVMIDSAYSLVLSGWNQDDFASFLGSGLCPCSAEEADELTKSTACRRVKSSEKPPYLVKFEKACRKASDASEHARVLAELLEDMNIAKKLTERAEELREAGRADLADEYLQIWNTVVSALEQINAAVGKMPMDASEFSRLLMTVLSKYDTGIIPVSLDSVTAGDFDRMRRRNLRHLLVLGASDDRIPRVSESTAVFSEDELETLAGMNIRIGAGPEAELWREFLLIENVMTLPSESLTVSWCGEPAFIIDKAEKDCARSITLRPVQAAREAVLAEKHPGRLESIRAGWAEGRGRLSEKSVRELYGEKIHISPSKADKYFSCKYAYFCGYGLEAKKWETEEFTAANLGTFMHDVLEHVAAEVKEGGGFAAFTGEDLEQMTKKHIDAFVIRELPDFDERTERFRYLFRRLESDVQKVVRDMAEELRNSSFEPVAFELNFNDPERFPPIELNNGKDALAMTGIADRVDVWENEGKKYLRIADYKTGKKDFKLSDIWYGLGMQMLLYLYAMKCSDDTVVPAGVMYVPANDKFVSADGKLDDAELAGKRAKAAKRKGIMLTDCGVPEAWEHGEDKPFSPDMKGEVTSENFDELFAHMTSRLGEMAGGIRSGEITADPYSTGTEPEPCKNCDFASVCLFADGENGDTLRLQTKMEPEEVWQKLREEAESDD